MMMMRRKRKRRRRKKKRKRKKLYHHPLQNHVYELAVAVVDVGAVELQCKRTRERGHRSQERNLKGGMKEYTKRKRSSKRNNKKKRIVTFLLLLLLRMLLSFNICETKGGT